MRARRAAAGAVALALLAPGTAHAQQRDARPAVGGGSFNDAPLLAPGRYTDTVRIGERLYYAFNVKGGQRLHIRALVPGGGEPLPAEFFAVDVWSPLRQPALGVDEDISGEDDIVSYTDRQIDFRTNRVDTLTTAERADGAYTGPGAWYVSFYLPSGEDAPLPVEVPVDFDVAVEGTPLSEPRRPPPQPAAAATPTPAQSGERGGTWAPGLVVAGLAGLAVGLAIVLLPRARSRARSA
jgi:Ca-activated chloride channel family protein